MKKGFIWRAINPLTPIVNATKSVKDASASIKESLKAIDSIKVDQLQSAEKIPEEIRTIKGPKERFEAMYKHNKWTKEELQEQLRAVRNTKFASLGMALIATIGTFVAILSAPLYTLIFAIPAGSCIVILGAAQALRYGLWEAQIKRREFIELKDYIALPDFWRRFLR